MNADTTPIDIDGSLGEGGGQILRSALTLAVLSGRRLRMRKIRAGRAKPGLMRQHLTCVKAAAQISAAEVQGAEVGATEIDFRPQGIAPGDHVFSVGTAGSTMLVLQTVLPVLLGADRPSVLRLEGGTHNTHAPSADFIEHCFLPAIARMGAQVRMKVERLGFYPAGGGRVVVEITPAPLHQVALNERGSPVALTAHVLVAGIPMHVAERELGVVAARFGLRPPDLSSRDYGARMGPGNALSLIARFPGITELVTALGERRVRAEDIAARACDEMASYLDSGAVVGEHLADQLLLPLLVAGGGEFITGVPSLHLTTNAQVIEAFGMARVEISRIDERTHRVRVA